MPPASFVADAVATIAAQAMTFTTPATAKGRDSLIAVLATASANTGPDLANAAGWSTLAQLTGATSTIWILRREALDADTGNISIPFLDALAWGRGALLVYRGLNLGASAIASSVSVITTSTNFVCPARTLATYSDLYLGVALVTSAATGVTPPGGTTERHEEQAGARTLEVFELLAEATGTTGTKTATTGAAQSGLAASIALAADPVVGFGLSFTFDPVGSVGLPVEGV